MDGRQKRARPLEDAETAAVELHTRMDVEVLHNCSEYAQKWPQSPLGRVLAMSLGTSSAAALTGKGDADAFGRPVATPSRAVKEEARTSASVNGKEVTQFTFDFSQLDVSTTSAAGASSQLSSSPSDVSALVPLELPEDWMRPLGFDGVAPTTLVRSAEYRALCQAVVDLEAAATAAWCSTPPALRSVLLLSQSMAREDAPKWRDRHPHILHGDLGDRLFQLWLSERRSSATALRPWGLPLIPAFFACDAFDEYFIPNTGRSTNGLKRTALSDFDVDIVVAKPWLRTADGNSASSSSRGAGRHSGAAAAAGAPNGTAASLNTLAAQLTGQPATPTESDRLPFEVRTLDGERLAYVTGRSAGLRIQSTQPPPSGPEGTRVHAPDPSLDTTPLDVFDRHRLWYCRVLPSSCCELTPLVGHGGAGATGPVAGGVATGPAAAPQGHGTQRTTRRHGTSDSSAVQKAPTAAAEAPLQQLPPWSSLEWKKTDAAILIRPVPADACQLLDLHDHEAACDACFD